MALGRLELERFTAEVSGVPLTSGGHVIGVFGVVKDVEEEEAPPAPHPDLTPRQAEILRMLARGRSTDQIADELHLSVETVRNHIRGIFRALGVHSRLQAVAFVHGVDLMTAPGTAPSAPSGPQ